jgi:tRNA(Phe) wybutosine-synthesizing methylase Tyw3
MIETYVTEEDFDYACDLYEQNFHEQDRLIKALAERIVELEKNAHKPVNFVADENGFLKIAKESE